MTVTGRANRNLFTAQVEIFASGGKEEANMKDFSAAFLLAYMNLALADLLTDISDADKKRLAFQFGWWYNK